MRLLLDTHVLIWSLTDPNRLSETTRDWIESGANTIAISIVSLWEIAIKNNLTGKARDPFPLSVEEAASGSTAAGFVTLPIKIDYLLEVERLERRHGDPFDRLLVATALVDDWRLLTQDRHLVAYGNHIMPI